MCCLLVGLCCCHFHVHGTGGVGGRPGDCACEEYWMKQTLKVLKIRILLLISTIIPNANWLWVWLLFL